MATTTEAQVLIDGLNRWQVQLGEAFNMCRAALEEGDYDAAAEVLTSVSQSQAKVSMNFRNAMRRKGWLKNEQ